MYDEKLNKEFLKLIQDHNLVKKLYQLMRIVDPINKKVVYQSGCDVVEKNENCYKFWATNTMCENCVSIRAYNEDDAYYKINYANDNIFLLTAIPIIMTGKRLVLELFNDVTNSMEVESKSYIKNKSNSEIQNIIENLNVLVVKDSLTGVYNRRFIEERLPIEINKYSKEESTVSIIMTDLDDFKYVNDTYGHVVGDEVIKQFAKIIKQCIRKEIDWVARYGGEEIFVCLPNTNSQKAYEISERIRKTLEEYMFEVQGQRFNVTASFGVCSLEKKVEIKEFIKCADDKLYQAKSNGKNQTVM
ncbi:MAG: GGDEF domain-containing protein [Eubacteriaceae bacterium]